MAVMGVGTSNLRFSFAGMHEKPLRVCCATAEVADAETKMLYVVDGFLEQSCDMVIVERVEHVSSLALANHQPEVTKCP